MLTLLLSCSPKLSVVRQFLPNTDLDAKIDAYPVEGECEHQCGPCPASPIIIDVAGNGFRLTDADHGVSFDLAPDRVIEPLSWTELESDDSWLALDRNGNGRIDDGTELFGNFTPQPLPQPGRKRNGYAALRWFDEDGDTVITVRDRIFASLRLWRDRNHNGTSESDELTTLQSHGIRGLGTDYRVHRRADNAGNLFRFSAWVYTERGTAVGSRSFDVFLVERLDGPATRESTAILPAPPSAGCPWHDAKHRWPSGKDKDHPTVIWFRIDASLLQQEEQIRAAVQKWNKLSSDNGLHVQLVYAPQEIEARLTFRNNDSAKEGGAAADLVGDPAGTGPVFIDFNTGRYKNYPYYDNNRPGYGTVFMKVALHELGHTFGLKGVGENPSGPPTDCEDAQIAGQSVMNSFICTGINDENSNDFLGYLPHNMSVCDERAARRAFGLPATEPGGAGCD